MKKKEEEKKKKKKPSEDEGREEVDGGTIKPVILIQPRVFLLASSTAKEVRVCVGGGRG